MSHHDFHGTTPLQEQALEPDEREQLRRHNAGIIAKTFTAEEGAVALVLLRKLAAHLPGEPIDYPDPGKTNQMLLWRAARVALIAEIELIIAKETNNG